MRTGSPGAPLTKFELFEARTVSFPSNVVWLRYIVAHAPERLPCRANGSRYQSPTCSPVSRSVTSHTFTSSWKTGTEPSGTGAKSNPNSSPAT